MSTWAELLTSGYRRVFGIQIEGIPVDFMEANFLTSADVPMTASTGRLSVSTALRLNDSESISAELDRLEGVARGRSLTIQLDLSVLAFNTDTSNLFRVPTINAILTETVSDPAATVFTVDSTTDWDASGSFFIGREYCTYSAKTATTFTGVTRGVAGYPHWHDAEAISSYKQLTRNSPIYFRGRLVTLFEHLVAPDNRFPFASGQVNTVSTFCRELWKGYIDEHPQSKSKMMTLKALPIERIFTQSIPTGRSGKITYVVPAAVGNYGAGLNGFTNDAFYVTDSDRIFVKNVPANVSEQLPRVGRNGVYSLGDFGRSVTYDVDTFLTSFTTHESYLSIDPETDAATDLNFVFKATFDSARAEVACANLAWFLGPPVETLIDGRPPYAPINLFATNFRFPIAPNTATNPWVIIDLEYDTTGVPQPWPTSGYIRLEGDDAEVVELARYDGIDTTIDPNGGYMAINVVERQLMGTPRVNPWKEVVSVVLLSGYSGTIQNVIRTIATSSGTGARGAYDTLGFGLGLGIPDNWLSLNIFPINTLPCDAISDQDGSISDIVGGWMALLGLCLVQRQQSDGTVKIEAVSTTIETSAYVTIIKARDIILKPANVEQMNNAPNVIKIENSFRDKKIETIIRDLPRIQAEGSREVSLVAPSITTGDIMIYGTKMLRLGDGQFVVSLTVAPNITLKVGDVCRLDTEHPVLWDWRTASSTATVPARIVGVSDALSGSRELTFLCPGQAKAGTHLCPSAQVTARTSQYALTVDDVTGFVVGQLIQVYRRGYESDGIATRTISDITGLVITVTDITNSTQYSVVNDTWITFANWDVADSDQREQLYVVTDHEFI